MRTPFLAISLANCYFTFKNIFMLPSLEDSSSTSDRKGYCLCVPMARGLDKPLCTPSAHTMGECGTVQAQGTWAGRDTCEGLIRIH